MAERDLEPTQDVTVIIELADDPPVTEAELEVIEVFLGDLIAELMSEPPEVTNQGRNGSCGPRCI